MKRGPYENLVPPFDFDSLGKISNRNTGSINRSASNLRAGVPALPRASAASAQAEAPVVVRQKRSATATTKSLRSEDLSYIY